MKLFTALSVLTALLSSPFSAAQPSIVELALGNEDLSTLVTALSTAGLVEALQGEGPFTVFAPVNSAFDALGNETVARLLSDPYRPHLVDVLTYHVLSGEVLSGDLEEGLSAEMLNGESVTVNSMDPVEVNGAGVVQADVEASNGVVHVVDEVLLPFSATNSIVDAAVGNLEFSTLVELLQLAGLAEVLGSSNPTGLTVFAPTNAAFAKLPAETIESLKQPENKDTLTDILLYHVANGVIMANDLQNDGEIITLNGQAAVVNLDSPVTTVSRVSVVSTDLLVSNGVIHVLDDVMMPTIVAPEPEYDGILIDDAVAADPELSSLSAALTLAGVDLGKTVNGVPLGQFTLFAPTDEAFAALGNETLTKLLSEPFRPHLEDVLSYHVLGGAITSDILSLGLIKTALNQEDINVTSMDPVQINGVSVIEADITTPDNGVIHKLDGVLLPSSVTTDIVDVALSNPDFSILVELLTVAELVDTLMGPGPLTVFAPTNAAFEALDPDLLESLLEGDEEDLLMDILTFHVTSGVIVSSSLMEGAEVTMLNGDAASVSMETETLVSSASEAIGVEAGVPQAASAVSSPAIAGAKIVAKDILVSNGVIHVVDAVMIPTNEVISEALEEATGGKDKKNKGD